MAGGAMPVDVDPARFLRWLTRMRQSNPNRIVAACSGRLTGSVFVMAACGLLAAGSGCSSLFNQSFINLVAQPVPDASGRVPGITLDNAPGHVVVVFINNTRFDQNLLDFFNSIGVDTSDEDLRPRVRVRVDIRYVNNNTTTFEFLDGASIVQNSVLTAEGLQVNPVVPRDLIENDLTNMVTVCDVSIVQPGGGIESAQSSIEVFVPAFLKEIEVVVTDLVVRRELNDVIPPRFVPLQTDDVDDNFNVILARNFDIRDIPVPATNLLCGTVVGFTLSGTLRLPFVQDELGAFVPGYLDTATAVQAEIPGRYDFSTTVR
jgi:hypothetical protein